MEPLPGILESEQAQELPQINCDWYADHVVSKVAEVIIDVFIPDEMHDLAVLPNGHTLRVMQEIELYEIAEKTFLQENLEEDKNLGDCRDITDSIFRHQGDVTELTGDTIRGVLLPYFDNMRAAPVDVYRPFPNSHMYQELYFGNLDFNGKVRNIDNIVGDLLRQFYTYLHEERTIMWSGVANKIIELNSKNRTPVDQ